jgi:acyl-[acyl-carrier-protein]-phospholipid O-acyltransferase/long-chain-fatty-acid--[acyl-carrier-protein] ligase
MLNARDWVVAASAVALAVSALYIFLPNIAQNVVRLVLWPRYGFRVLGRENVPRTGPALLAPNHTSWLDGFVLAAVCPRHGRVLVNAGIVDRPVLREVAVRSGMIPTPYVGPRAIRAVIQASRDALDHGHCLGLFPEGQISRTGMLGPFYRGVEVILNGRNDVPVIPMAIDNLWGSIFSRSGGRFFHKWPRGLRRTVNVVFGTPVPPPVTVWSLRLALQEAMVRAYELRGAPGPPLDSIDPALPSWRHPDLGLLTASTQDVHIDDVHQIGHKAGTVGHPVPGVAVRAVDDAGNVLPPDAEGRLQALVAFHPGGWADTGRAGRLDRDGFVRLA